MHSLQTSSTSYVFCATSEARAQAVLLFSFLTSPFLHPSHVYWDCFSFLRRAPQRKRIFPLCARGKGYSTRGSRVITDLSTSMACSCLTSQIGRDVVFSAECGRTRWCASFSARASHEREKERAACAGASSGSAWVGVQRIAHKTFNYRYKSYSFCTLLVC